MNDTYLVFKGKVEKIVLECKCGGYCPHEPDLKIRQRLTLRRNGNVALTRYFAGNFSKVPPTDGYKTMKRYKNMHTSKLMDYIASYFRKPYIPDFYCDGAMWGIGLTNTDGNEFTYAGSIGNEIAIDGELSQAVFFCIFIISGYFCKEFAGLPSTSSYIPNHPDTHLQIVISFSWLT